MNQLRAGMERAAGMCMERRCLLDEAYAKGDVSHAAHVLAGAALGEMWQQIRAAMPREVRPSPEAEAEAIDRIRAIANGEQCTVDAIQAVLDDLFGGCS